MSEQISTEDVDNWLNFQLICKPEQSGKTFIMISQIIKDLTFPIEGKKIINFILCDNNLLLTHQTGSRVDQDLKEYIVAGTTYVELSSHARAECKNVREARDAITHDNVRNIICCANRKRMDDIKKIIDALNTSEYTAGKFHFNVWLDEADKFITFIENPLRPIVDEHSNVKVKLITATPEDLFKKYKYMNVLPIENTTSEFYHGWEDNDIKQIDHDGDYLEFAEHILTIATAEQLSAGSKWFIPGLNLKKSHEEIKNLCISKGMAVICINGNGIILTLPITREKITFKKDEVFNTKMIDIYTKYSLHRFPLAITGYICIGRGITIMSNDFMLDYAILSNCSDKNEVSQLAGRVKGNIKGFTNYKKPVVFTTEKFDAIAVEWEGKSRELAKLAFEKEQNGEPTIIGKSEYKGITEPWFVRHGILYDSYNEARDFLDTPEIQIVMVTKINITDSSPIHDCNGYKVTSKILKSGKTVADLTMKDRIIINKNDPGNGTNISTTSRGSSYLILPIYENENSPPESVKYQVRYYNKEIHKEHKEKEKEKKDKKIGGGSALASGGGI